MQQLDNFELFPSQDDSSYVAIHGELAHEPVNVRVLRTALDDLAHRFGGAPSAEQRRRFVRNNLESFREIAQAKIDSGDSTQEDWYGRSAIAIRVELEDIERYTRDRGVKLSDAAFDPQNQARWVGPDGRF